MGARGVRLRPKHQDEVRAKIQSSQIVNRLQNHLDGKVELSATQVKAAEILLRKSIPDLSATTISGDPDNPLVSVDLTDSRNDILRRLGADDGRAGDTGMGGETVQ